jgi:hypothetical protein
MTTSVSVSVYLLLISNLLLISAVGLAIVRFLHRIEEFEQFWASPNGTALSDESTDNLQLQQGQRLEQRVDELHRIVRLMAVRNDVKAKSVPTAAPAATVLPMENALRMAKQGASIEDLTRSCGLNIGEARLMQKLHGKAQLAAGGM